ncbi:MAG: tetratricopeptide repeat protein [Deltaproteobacteria bacterium]|nr:tetratricopeptide repeat protein [Deltaproteobacteria bacterium]
MIRRKLFSSLSLAAVVVLALSAWGCSGRETSGARRLTRHEADKLLARQTVTEEEEPSNDPLRLEAHGDRLALSGQWSGALFQYNRALALAEDGQDKLELRSKMAKVYLKSGLWVQAEEVFSLLTAKRAEDAEAWQGLGLARLAQGKLDDVEDALTKALALEAKLWPAHNGLGILYNWRGEPKKAVLAFGRALELKPDSPAINNNLGLSFLIMGELDLAETCFKRALELAPDYRLAANNLGLVYARQNRRTEALRAFERSVGRARAHNNLGCLLFWQGRSLEAADEFKAALKAMPLYYQLASRHLTQVEDYLR